MIPELGQLALVLAFLLCILQGGMPLFARLVRPHGVMHLVKPAAFGVFLLISFAFAALIFSYVVSDFSVLNVVLNSHSTKPMLYKIVGSWGNHEGSMLLWMWVLAACGFLVSFLPSKDLPLKYLTLAVLGQVAAGFLAFILFTSNPFLRVFPVPLDGEDLNPILQDIGLAFHPPTLYVGYVGFGVVFAYAIAGLLLRRISTEWAREVQPWILMPWSFLTFGIAAGSWWAYRELGWGGWWFWDPVENVSLLPWLVGAALLHSNMVLERRGQLGGWVVLLAIMAFTLSLIGTFIVRSGLITSVHAFASDPTRGLFILGYIGVVSGVALLIYSFRAVPKTSAPRLLSRSGFILINNLLLVAGAGIILIAILYPLGLELAGKPSISVGPPYFNRTFLPITAGLPLLAALAPLMAWDRVSLPRLRALLWALAPSLLAAGLITLAFFNYQRVLAFAGIALACWMAYGTWLYWQRLLRAKVRLTSLSGLRYVASAVAHLGLALFVLGMVTSGLLKHTYELPLTAGKPMVMGDYTLTPTRAEKVDSIISAPAVQSLRYAKDGQLIATLTPELRYYPVRNMQTSEAARCTPPRGVICMVLGEANYSADKNKQAALGVRLYVTPGQQLVWYGFILAGLGGFIAFGATLLGRRK